jgi:UV excision repair protein RAD23
MRLSFKTLDNKHFSIEDVSPDSTVDELKRTLGSREELRWDPAKYHESRLIYAGRVLSEPSQKLGDCGLRDNDFLVVMPPLMASTRSKKPAVVSMDVTNSTKTAQGKQATSSKGSASTSTSPDSNAVLLGNSAVGDNAGFTRTAESPPKRPTVEERQANLVDIASPGLVTGDEYSLYLGRMRDMGFDDASIEKAMRAAHHNPERAIEYLCSGFPEVGEDSASRASDGAALPNTSAASNRGGGYPGLNQQYESSGAEAGAHTNELEILRRLPHFALLRRAIQQDPSQIQALLAELRRIDPRLLDLIQRNQAEFINMMNEPVSDEEAERELRQLQELVSDRGPGDDGSRENPASAESMHAIRVEVTEEEADQLRRLEQMMEPMGVSRETCIQIWLSCDKNIELAAMHIMDNLEEYTSNAALQSDDDEGGA